MRRRLWISARDCSYIRRTSSHQEPRLCPLSSTFVSPSARAWRGDRGRRRRPVGAAAAAVPARSRQHLSDRGRRGLCAARHRHRQRRRPASSGNACSSGLLKGRPLTRDHLQPLPSRPYGAGGLAVPAARSRTLREPDRISRCADDPARSRRAQRRALSRLLPAATASASSRPSCCSTAACTTCAWSASCRAPSTALMAEETLEIGGRSFEVLTGGGHSSEQVMLYCREGGFILCADQVMAEDLAQHQRRGDQSQRRSARRLSALAGRRSNKDLPAESAGPARPQPAVRRPARRASTN